MAMSDINSDLPLCIITLGMAGAGKTTFVGALQTYLKNINKNPYVVNLDPAVAYLPYSPDIDIRSSVAYGRVKTENNLGPNGAIMASMGLFSTKIDQLIDIFTKKSHQDNRPNYFIMDTPGQIEVFTWSASGSIITQALSSRFPTMIAYVMDTAVCTNVNTFMQNMLYSCGILYQYNLPFLCVFNKIDIIDSKFVYEWMTDFEAFDEALRERQTDDEQNQSEGYLDGFTQSLALVLDKFYENISTCSVSSLNLEGFDDLLRKADVCRHEYFESKRVDGGGDKRGATQEEPLPGDDTLEHDLLHNLVMEDVIIDASGRNAAAQGLSRLRLDDVDEDEVE